MANQKDVGLSKWTIGAFIVQGVVLAGSIAAAFMQMKGNNDECRRLEAAYPNLKQTPTMQK